MKKSYFAFAAAGIVALGAGSYSKAGTVRINEAVVDPVQDFNDDGLITPSDEYFEFGNEGPKISLDGWTFKLVDSTPVTHDLSGFIDSGGFFVVQNPVGEQNNNGRLELYDNLGVLVDAWSYGNWEGNEFNIPDGNSTNYQDQSLSRFPDGVDTFFKTIATRGTYNVPESSTILSVLAGATVLAARRRTYTTKTD